MKKPKIIKNMQHQSNVSKTEATVLDAMENQ